MARTKSGQKEYFSLVFPKLYDEWKASGKRRSYKVFADLLSRDAQNQNITSQSVYKWHKGECCPLPSMIPHIANVLGVDASTLFLSEDLLESVFTTPGINSQLSRTAQIAITRGLNLQFLRGLRALMGPEFDQTFPFYNPVNIHLADLQDPDGFDCLSQRNRRGQVAAATGEYSLLQIDKDGSRYSLLGWDLDFIKSLQDQVLQLVRQRFAERQQYSDNLQSRVEEAIRKSPHEEYWQIFEDAPVVKKPCNYQFTAAQLNQVDPLGNYQYFPNHGRDGLGVIRPVSSYATNFKLIKEHQMKDYALRQAFKKKHPKKKGPAE